MTAEERARLSVTIRREALCFGIGWADRAEIDALNILQATFLAMRRALLAMTLVPDHVLVDGNQLPTFGRAWLRSLTARAIIDGDATEPAISAASILAKTARDNYMNQMDTLYPAYSFRNSQGLRARRIISGCWHCTVPVPCTGARSSRCVLDAARCDP